MGYKVGTWLIDEALKKSGKTVNELTIMPNEDIIKLSEVMK
jgi:uncharacterized protein YjaZ